MGAHLLRLTNTITVVWIGLGSIAPGYVAAMENADVKLQQQTVNSQLSASPIQESFVSQQAKSFTPKDNGGPDHSLGSGTRNNS